MIDHVQTIRGYAAIILFVALIGVPVHVQADDVNPQIANCEEITDPATQAQVDACTAHVGCKLVMGIHKACTKVKTFLNNLKNLVSGKDKIDSSDVFDAAAPPAEGDTTFNAISKSIKTNYDKQPKKEIVSGKFENGVNWVYEGGMKDGVRNGTGVLITDTGATFRGDFVEGRQAGLGELFNDKSHKAGVMVGAKMNGDGMERYANGKRYEGEYKNDKPDGKGVTILPSGARHEGSYKDGLFSGQGTYKYPDGDEYTGNFERGNFNGQGTYKSANGNQYTGNWVEDKRQGRGTYTWADGSRFEGEWRDNKKFDGTETNAKGSKIYYANGVVAETPKQQPQTATQQAGKAAAPAGGATPAPGPSAATSNTIGNRMLVCEAERQQARVANPITGDDVLGVITSMLKAGPVFHPAMGKGNATITSVYPNVVNDTRGLKEWALSLERFMQSQQAPGGFVDHVPSTRLEHCLVRTRLVMLEQKDNVCSTEIERAIRLYRSDLTANKLRQEMEREKEIIWYMNCANQAEMRKEIEWKEDFIRQYEAVSDKAGTVAWAQANLCLRRARLDQCQR